MTLPDGTEIEARRRDLLAWFDADGRDLPWRSRPRDPWRVLVSETLLQQVQVAQGRGHYERLVAAFPTAEAMAAAPLERVLEVWSGMGRYARAPRLHRAARAVAEGGWPGTAEGLRALPGVGPYTAAALGSIALGLPEAAVDGNVRRVLARWHDEPDPSPSWLRARAAEALDPSRPGDWNEALMDLGATVCVPRRPRCPSCPVSSHCRALASGRQAGVPAPPRRPAPRRVRAVALAAGSGGRYLLERRPEGGPFAGTRGVPMQEVEGGADGAAFTALLGRLGLAGRARRAGVVRHSAGGRELEVVVFSLEGELARAEDPSGAALTALDRKVLRLLEPAAPRAVGSGDPAPPSSPDALREPEAAALAAFLRAHLGRDLVQVAGECRVVYSGRASSVAEAGGYLVIVKPDSSVQVHGPAGVRPANWQPRADELVVSLEGGAAVLTASRRRPRESVRVEFSRPALAQALELRPGPPVALAGSEADLRAAVVRDPGSLEPGFEVLEVEAPTPVGAIDLLGRDREGRRVVVEFKRSVMGQAAVSQLARYVEWLRGEGPGEVRGLLAGPGVSRPARRHLERLGLEFVELHAPRAAALPGGGAAEGASERA